MVIERGFVVVDEYCRTSVPTISAVGDLIPGPQLAHVGFAEGILVAERVSGLKVTPIDYDGVPRITYCDPEVASVGITSAMAAERGIETVEFTYPLGGERQERDPADAGRGQGHRHRADDRGGQPGPVLGIHLVGAAGGRADRRGPAHLQLGGGAGRRGTADPPAPHPVGDHRRGASRTRGQAAARPRVTARLYDKGHL